MKTVWKEYGLIGVLMVVAIGGYLYVSQAKPDFMDQSLGLVGQHLLAMVPDRDHDRIAESLDHLRSKVRNNEVAPEQIERFAASVLNMGSAGDSLIADEADMLVRMAYESGDALPVPETAAVRRTKPTPESAPRDAERMNALGLELISMVEFFSDVRAELPMDSSGAHMPGIRFYADDGLHVMVDERMREEVESHAEARAIASSRKLEWKSRLAESIASEKERLMGEAEYFADIRVSHGDSIQVSLERMNALSILRKLEAGGLVSDPMVDSVMIDIERDIERAMRIFVISPRPPAPRSSGASTSIRSGSHPS